MAAAPSLSRTSSAVGKFEARLVNGRVGMRRSLLFVAVAAGLGYLVLSHFISLDTVLPGYFPSSSFSSSLSSSPRSKGSPSATTDAALALRPPDEYLDPPRIRLELQNPVYNVRVMRSILQHSNTSWQGKPDEAKGYFIQSLIWMQVVDGLRPDKPGDALDARCRFPDASSTTAEEHYTLTPGHIHAWPVHPDDRKVGHDFAFYVECELPQAMQASPHQVRELTLALTMQAGTLHTDTVKGKGENITMMVGKSDIPVAVTPPMTERSEFAVCLSPLTYSLQGAPLWSMLEWRLYMADIGVERVNWYGREASLEKFVTEYKRLKGSKDTFMQVPNLIWHEDREPIQYWEKYADQDVWYMECIMRNALTSDFILVIDTDEYPMVDWSQPAPLDGFKEFMRNIPATIGSISFERQDMVRESSLGKPSKEDLFQTQFSCLKKGKHNKTIYRANATYAVNQHMPRQRYPMPADIRAQVPKARPYQDYGWQSVKSFDEGVWPKMLHYRWYNDKTMDTCQENQPSPMGGEPAYVAYLDKTKKEVAELVKHIRQAQSV